MDNEENTVMQEETVSTPEPVTKSGKIRTSITIRPEFVEKSKLSGKSVSAVIDAALSAYFG